MAVLTLAFPLFAFDTSAFSAALPSIEGGREGNRDVSITGRTTPIDDEPSVAANPTSPNRLVAGVQHLAGPCNYYHSVDGGASWHGPFVAPLTPGGATCFDISVRASPDGRFFYLSYLSVQGSEAVSDVAVFRLNGDFSGTRGPFIAMRRRPALIDKDWIDVHEVDPSRPAEVYVTATYFSENNYCAILFARSSNYGKTWSHPRDLARYPGCTFDLPGELGARAIGGLGSSLLICWYDTGSDGWGPGSGGGGTFGITCRSSSDDGATFGPRFHAVHGEANELPYQSCPKGKYQRIWGSMLPAMSIAPDGSAHITYATDPTPGNNRGECGDIQYVRSPGPPYDTWTAPVTVAGGPEAQSYPTIVAVSAPGGGCDVHIAYLDARNSPPWKPNRRYDAYRVESTDCGLTWSDPIRVGDTSSLAQTSFIGDYIDMTAAPGGEVHVVWTDRRHNHGVSDPGSDVYTDQWAP